MTSRRLLKISFKDGAEYYRKLHTIFNLTAAIPILPFAYLYLERSRVDISPTVLPSEYLNFAIVALLIMISFTTFYAIKLYRKHLQSAIDMASLRDKLVLYYNMAVWKFSTLEVAMLLAVLGYYLTNSGLFIIAFVTLLILLSLGRPTIRKIVVDLRLSKMDEGVLLDKIQIP